MKYLWQPLLLWLWLSANLAEGAAIRPAEISKVDVAPCEDGVKIDVTLTEGVSPRVLTAVNPDRLVLELPNTRAEAKQRHIPVDSGAVKDLRIGLRSAAPLLTRVVVDLGRSASYELLKVGNTISLVVLAGNGAGRVAEASAMVAPELIPVAGAALPMIHTSDRKRMRIGFRVKYVAEGAAYLEGGRR